MSKSVKVNLPDMSFKLNETSKKIDVCNKITSLLLSTRLHSIDYTKKECDTLFKIPSDQREEFVKNTWGPIAAAKVQPLLLQLKVFEKESI